MRGGESRNVSYIYLEALPWELNPSICLACSLELEQSTKLDLCCLEKSHSLFSVLFCPILFARYFVGRKAMFDSDFKAGKLRCHTWSYYFSMLM